MNLKQWTSALTVCAVTFAASFAGVAPATAANDTSGVGEINANLQAAADAMNAATQHLNGNGGNTNNSGSGGATNTPQKPSTGDTDTLGFDYVSLADPAVTYSGQVYLPLRSTFKAMKTEALEPTWKPEGQSKIKLTNSKGTSYEVYLTANETGVQIQQGGTTYGLKNVNGVTYVPLTFFQSMIQSANVGLSGNNLLVLEAKNGTSVWNSGKAFWTGLNAYKAPVAQKPSTPAPQPPQPDVSYPEVDKPVAPAPQPQKPSKPVTPAPDVTYPDVNKPVTPAPQPNKPTTPNKPSVPNTGGSVGSSKVPVKPCPGGNGLIADTLFWPTSVTYVSSLYGYRVDPVGGLLGDFHLGVDIAGPVGTPIYAAQGGKVIRASWFSTYGNCIDIQHPSGLVTRYAHLSAYNVSVGDTVKQGQTIAAMGATGNVTGPHVHFETIINGSTVDPANYLNLSAAK